MKASKVLLLVLLIMLSLCLVNTQPVKSQSSGTIYIRSDGSVEGTDKIQLDGNVYTFTGNINGSIVVEKDNVVVDGAGYTLRGDGGVEGIWLEHRRNVTIKNMQITHFGDGIRIMGNGSQNNTIIGNNITDNGHETYGNGIELTFGASHTTICGNNITDNWVGVFVYMSGDNIISENYITANRHDGVWICAVNNSIIRNDITNNGLGVLVEIGSNIVYHNNFVNNTVQAVIGEAPPVVSIWDDGYPSGGNHWSNYTGTDANHDGIGDTLYIIDENNRDRYPLMYPWSPLPVHNINTGLGYATIQEAINSNETLDGHTIFVETGTYYEHVVVNKTVSLIGENRDITIIDGSEIVTPIVHITANNVTVKAFTIQNSGRIYGWEGGGIYMTDSNRNNIVDNTITNTQYGINLRNSTSNTIIGNTIIENDVGIQFLDDYSSNSTIYHNNFIDNGWQVNNFAASNNTWDNGYPSGGNYWSDYEERYPNATEIDGSGKWDTPYVINENNQDNYPLIPEFPTWTQLSLVLMLLAVILAIYKRRLLKTPIQ